MKTRAAFTLVELLVVIGILAILAAILFPVIASATHASRRAHCLSNLRQLYMAQKMYSDDYDRTLVPARAGLYTWSVILQSHLKNDRILICPEDQAPQTVSGLYDLPHSYGINYNLTFNTTSQPFVYSMSTLTRTTDLLLFFDMKSSAQAMGASYYTHRLTRLDARHNGLCGFAFLDGHVKMLKPEETIRSVNMWLP